jgi:hypothetical protein
VIDLQTMTTFLGWCAVFNVGLLLFTAMWLMVFRDFTKKIHSAILGVDQDSLDAIYIQFMGNLKIAVIVFNVVPYFALKMMA